MTSLEEAKKIAEVLDSKKAQEIKVLKVADLTFVAEYFVLATGTSSTQVKSLAEEGCPRPPRRQSLRLVPHRLRQCHRSHL